MGVIDRIRKIGERWFLTEPLLFAVYCSHEFCENDSLAVAMRTGNRKVEFAPKILENASDAVLTEFLKVEMFRILLKHPYQRQPPFAAKPLLTRASNATIADVYEVSRGVKKQMNGMELNLPGGLCFEEYYNLLKEGAASANLGSAGDAADDGDGEKSALGNGCAGEQGESASGEGAADGNGGENGADGSRNLRGKTREKQDAQIS